MYCNQLFYLHFHQDRISYHCPGDEISVTWVNLAIRAFPWFYLILSAIALHSKYYTGLEMQKHHLLGITVISSLSEVLSVTLALVSSYESWIVWVTTGHCDLWLGLYLKTLSQSLLCLLRFVLYCSFCEGMSLKAVLAYDLVAESAWL